MNVFEQQCIIAPSLISCADMCNLQRSIEQLEQAGIGLLHVDILDGHFSPSMPLGLDAVRALRKITDMPFDVHLMATKNDYFVEELLDIGVQQLVVHAETEPHIEHRLNQIRARGVRAGLALKPSTPLDLLDYALESCDAVLLMLINPGYASSAGEGQVAYSARKIRELRGRISERGLPTKVILDGRISRQNIIDYGVAGLADIFVAGSTCLDKTRLAESAAELIALQKSIAKGAAL
jgi:ribulose-phosphate 3-epimerase